MSENRRRILEMLSEGKINIEEAERLLSLVDKPEAAEATRETSVATAVETREGMGDRMGEFGQRIGENIGRHVGELGERIGEELEKHMEKIEGHHEHIHDDEHNHNMSSSPEETFEVGESPALDVKSFNGLIELKAGDEGVIKVNAKLKNASRMVYHTRKDGDTVFVEARKKEGFSLFPRQSGARIFVTAPPATVIDLATSNGRIVVNDIEGSGPMRTSNGRIILDNVKGNHEAITSNGRIEVSGLEGDNIFKTSNGSIRIKDAHGSFQAVTSNGSITFEGDIEDGTQNSMETSNGSITARFGKNPNVRVKAHTTNGKVTSDLTLQSVTSQDRTHLDAVLGTGTGELVLKTTNGSVNLQEA